MPDTIKIAVDTTMPPGRCVVLVDGDIVFGGPIGELTEAIMNRPGAILVLAPVDFADGEAFMKATRH